MFLSERARFAASDYSDSFGYGNGSGGCQNVAPTNNLQSAFAIRKENGKSIFLFQLNAYTRLIRRLIDLWNAVDDDDYVCGNSDIESNWGGTSTSNHHRHHAEIGKQHRHRLLWARIIQYL